MDSPGTINKQADKTLNQMIVNDDDVNILLLGETGVGKSTFINSFANYLEYGQFEVAEKEEIRCLIPGKFTVTNQYFEEETIQFGKTDDANKLTTLETKSYLFPIAKRGMKRIRLIDTPSIGDTRGINDDNENLENILSYISYLKNLHAICFLLKPDKSITLSQIFEHYFKELLSRLGKSASGNIIFLFTNTRNIFNQPSDGTATALRTILHEIKSKAPYTNIDFMEDNVFCLDNAALRYLVAAKNGIQLRDKETFINSWNHSMSECWRMLYFITGQCRTTIRITPHKVKDTTSFNEARRVIIQIFRLLTDIAENIYNKIRILQRYLTTDCNRLMKSFGELRTKMLRFNVENDFIIKTIAKCAHLLQWNSITSNEDPYRAYIEYLIDRELSLINKCDMEVIKHLSELSMRYEKEKSVLHCAMIQAKEFPENLRITDIFDVIKPLYNLSHTGKKIRQMLNQTVKSETVEHGNGKAVPEEGTRRATSQNESKFTCAKYSKSMNKCVICNECKSIHHPSCISKISGNFAENDEKTYYCKSVMLIKQELQEKERIINELKEQIDEINRSHDETKRLIENLTNKSQKEQASIIDPKVTRKIMGKGMENIAFVKATRKWLYSGRYKPEFTVEKLSAMLIKNFDTNDIAIDEIIKQDSYTKEMYKAFKIGFPSAIADEDLFNPLNWPNGIQVKVFLKELQNFPSRPSRGGRKYRQY